MNILQLCDAYLTDPDSPVHKLRYVTQEGYKRLISRLVRDLGDRDLATIGSRDLLHAHAAWMEGTKVAMAHSLATMLRVIIGFGSTILENQDCMRLRLILTGMRFKNSERRTVWLTAEQGEWVRDEATEKFYYAIALAQALQTSTAMRQKDILGEYVPLDDPEPSTILNAKGTMKWVRGVTREEVNADLIITHKTSKRGQVLSFNLSACEPVMEEWFSAPPSGPLIIDPETDLPYEAWKFRRTWRWLADLAGVPKNVWNMDTRAGRITQIIADGATLEDARKFAGHRQTGTTAGYSRGDAEAIDRVLKGTSKRDDDNLQG